MMVAMEIRHSILRSFIRVHLSSIYNKSSSIGPCRLKHKPRHSVKYEHNIMKHNALLNSTAFCKLYNEIEDELHFLFQIYNVNTFFLTNANANKFVH